MTHQEGTNPLTLLPYPVICNKKHLTEMGHTHTSALPLVSYGTTFDIRSVDLVKSLGDCRAWWCNIFNPSMWEADVVRSLWFEASLVLHGKF